MAPGWFESLTRTLRGGNAESNARRAAEQRAKAFREEVRRALAGEDAGAGRGSAGAGDAGVGASAGDGAGVGAGRGVSREVLEALLRKPAEVGLPEEDVELEIEALQGALDALSLREAIARGGGELPIVEHQHKALGDDRCHFLASVFLASDAADRTGRLFLTDRRLLFLASPLLSLSWGSVAAIEAQDRDLVIAAVSRGVVYRFRCNSFSDARCGAVIAQALKNGGSSPRDSSAKGADGQSGPR